ncbi:hypothetical protein [Roseovarius sp. Pro17]|uniref:NAD(P)/FAD-dependent oxidoreductase n=1 Tax=Roseovarius sp. Pro17 TaxID=3108175 RepID=UPI002D783F48|nr:hypothetical protein [Roseovarius sp. Pro17]
MDAHLLDMARAAGVVYFVGRRIAQIDTDAISLTLEYCSTLSGAIMIGANGVNSLVARTLSGWSFDPETIGFALAVEAPPMDEPQAIRVVSGRPSMGLWLAISQGAQHHHR